MGIIKVPLPKGVSINMTDKKWNEPKGKPNTPVFDYSRTYHEHNIFAEEAEKNIGGYHFRITSSEKSKVGIQASFWAPTVTAGMREAKSLIDYKTFSGIHSIEYSKRIDKAIYSK